MQDLQENPEVSATPCLGKARTQNHGIIFSFSLEPDYRNLQSRNVSCCSWAPALIRMILVGLKVLRNREVRQ